MYKAPKDLKIEKLSIYPLNRISLTSEVVTPVVSVHRILESGIHGLVAHKPTSDEGKDPGYGVICPSVSSGPTSSGGT